MTQLPRSLRQWGQPTFESALKQELQQLEPHLLPLQHAVTEGGLVDGSPIEATITKSEDDGAHINVKAGIFFTEMVPSCSCGDEPQSKPVYCELIIKIDKDSAETEFILCLD
ncbi:glucosamine--fructose-6-phosphate aminotransferase [Pseudomonadota bacterium]